MWTKILLVCVPIFLPLASSSAIQNEEDLLHQYFAHPKDVNSGVTPRIIGGVEVTPNSYPFQASLYMVSATSVSFCGGTLITNRAILTAAHCVDKKPNYILVLLGHHSLTNLSSSTVVYNTTSYVYHKKWNEDTFQNDVAIVKLPRNVTFTDNIQPVELDNSTDTYENVTASIIGWGVTELGDMSDVLKRVNATVMNNAECANMNIYYKQIIQPMHVCTSGSGIIGSCSGDSGGPLLLNGKQIGIVSFGTTNCSLGMPSVFARVGTFHDWIVTHAGGPSGPQSLQFAVIVAIAMCFAQFFR